MGVSHLSLFCFFCICSVEREGGSLNYHGFLQWKKSSKRVWYLIDASTFSCEPYFGTVRKLISRTSPKYLLVKKKWRSFYCVTAKFSAVVSSD